MAKHLGIVVVAALGMTLLAATSQAEDSPKGGSPSSSPSPKEPGKGSGGGHDGQIAVPAPFARGSAFLLLGERCRLMAPWKWMTMAEDTRDAGERAGGVDSPEFPIACARTGSTATCKIFQDGLTYAFTTSVKTDTPSQLVLATAGGFIELAVDLQKKTATFTQTPPKGDAQSCTAKYRSREESAADVEKLDPPPSASLPAKDRPNGMNSGGERLACKSHHETASPKDPLTGRQTRVCSACTDSCGFVGEECKAGICVYTGKGDTRGQDYGGSSSSSSSSKPDAKKAKKGLGESCKWNDDCASKHCGTISSGSLHKCVSR